MVFPVIICGWNRKRDCLVALHPQSRHVTQLWLIRVYHLISWRWSKANSTKIVKLTGFFALSIVWMVRRSTGALGETVLGVKWDWHRGKGGILRRERLVFAVCAWTAGVLATRCLSHKPHVCLEKANGRVRCIQLPYLSKAVFLPKSFFFYSLRQFSPIARFLRNCKHVATLTLTATNDIHSEHDRSNSYH